MDDLDVWPITMRDVGVLGHVLHASDGIVTYQLPEDIAGLLKQQIGKVAHMPKDLRRALVHEFFSCFLQNVSDGLCTAELLPAFDLDSHNLGLEWAGSAKPAAISVEERFIYLRRFTNPIPTLSIVANAVHPGSVSYVPAIFADHSIRACYFFDQLLHRRAYRRVSAHRLRGDGWLKAVAILARGARGVIIDTHRFHLRGEAVATGLEGEMGLSMMLPLDVARVYIAREHDPLPRWIPEQLVVRVPQAPAALQRARRRVERTILQRLNLDLQLTWRPFYRRCHDSWERVMALEGIRYDPQRGVIPWNAA